MPSDDRAFAFSSRVFTKASQIKTLYKLWHYQWKKTVEPKVSLSTLAGIALVFLVSGCATIMHGTTQSIGISSTPTGASVSVDNIAHGQTPVVAPLSRKDNH